MSNDQFYGMKLGKLDKYWSSFRWETYKELRGYGHRNLLYILLETIATILTPKGILASRTGDAVVLKVNLLILYGEMGLATPSRGNM